MEVAVAPAAVNVLVAVRLEVEVVAVVIAPRAVAHPRPVVLQAVVEVEVCATRFRIQGIVGSVIDVGTLTHADKSSSVMLLFLSPFRKISSCFV